MFAFASLYSKTAYYKFSFFFYLDPLKSKIQCQHWFKKWRVYSPQLSSLIPSYIMEKPISLIRFTRPAICLKFYFRENKITCKTLLQFWQWSLVPENGGNYIMRIYGQKTHFVKLLYKWQINNLEELSMLIREIMSCLHIAPTILKGLVEPLVMRAHQNPLLSVKSIFAHKKRP